MVAISRIALALFAATAYAAVQNPEDCTTTTTTSDCETSTSMTWGHPTTTKPSTPTQTPDDDDDDDVCGSGMELNCCNRQVSQESADVGPHGSGLLSGLVNGLAGGAGSSILGDCSPIDVASRKFFQSASFVLLMLIFSLSHWWWCPSQRPDLHWQGCLLQPFPGRCRWWSHQPGSALHCPCWCRQLSFSLYPISYSC